MFGAYFPPASKQVLKMPLGARATPEEWCLQMSKPVKTRSNSFHSTLEPNTEVFSKVSRSLAQFTLVNSVSTLLNKGGNTCNCAEASEDF